MNDQNTNTRVYAQKVELLLRLVPIVMEEGVFAIHGGTAINLFLKDLPRYSVDIDLTYTPLNDRATSLEDINLHLKSICEKAKRAFKGMHIVPNLDTCKLLCEYHGKQVKIEVNQTKRGVVGGDVLTIR
jgi:predicted nucleotidyltransferase component of viral defense system